MGVNDYKVGPVAKISSMNFNMEFGNQLCYQDGERDEENLSFREILEREIDKFETELK